MLEIIDTFNDITICKLEKIYLTLKKKNVGEHIEINIV